MFLTVCAGLPTDAADAVTLAGAQLVEITDDGTELATAGRNLQEEMKIQPKPLNRIKLSGTNANEVLDNMLSELN